MTDFEARDPFRKYSLKFVDGGNDSKGDYGNLTESPSVAVDSLSTQGQ
jgi:hypothetical protein